MAQKRRTSFSRVENEHGILEINPGCDVQAAAWGSWTFRWQPARRIEPGGGMEIILVPRFPTNRWSLPQIADPIAPGYVTVRAPEGVLATADIIRWPLMHKPHGATLHIIQSAIGGRALKKGESLDVTYGNQLGGSLGTQAQLSAREVAFPVFVSSGQGPKFLERFAAWNRATDVATLRNHSDFNPTLMVTGGAAAQFHVVAPMEVAPGDRFEVRIAVMDAHCNAASGYEGEALLSSTDPDMPPPSPIPLAGPVARVDGICLRSRGFHRIHVMDSNRRLLGVSNPIRVIEDAQPIFWGEVHAHSELSDGNGTPDEHYTYARDTALLDFACVTDHDTHLYKYPERWLTAMEKASEYTREGEFVALLGYEGRMRSDDGSEGLGDINVYYRGAEGRMLQPFRPPLLPEQLSGEEVILVPHSPLYGPEAGMGTHWRYLTELPPEKMPLVEVFSTHGNSEYYDCPRHVLWQARGQSVVEALQQGFRLGMIGSSDYHEVLCGNSLRIQDTPRTINNRHMQARCGLAAVRAPMLAREALFDTMRKRVAYATSGIRGYLDFRVNGYMMGTECSIEDLSAPRRILLAAAAPERMVKIEIIRNGDTVADLADGGWRFEGEWTDQQSIPDGAFYYLRVTTEREDFMWSSPIWMSVRRNAQPRV